MATRKINGVEYPIPGIDTAIRILRPNAKYELYNTEFLDWECPDGSEPPSWDEVELIDISNKITDGSHNPPKEKIGGSFKMLSSKNI